MALKELKAKLINFAYTIGILAGIAFGIYELFFNKG